MNYNTTGTKIQNTTRHHLSNFFKKLDKSNKVLVICFLKIISEFIIEP